MNNIDNKDLFMEENYNCKKVLLVSVLMSFIIVLIAALIVYCLSSYSGSTISSAQSRLAVYDSLMHPSGNVNRMMYKHIIRNGGITKIVLASKNYHETMYGREVNVTAQVFQRRRFDPKTGMRPTTYVVTVHLIHTVVGWRTNHWYHES